MIAIEDMEMPKSCGNCRFSKDGWCFAQEAWDTRYEDVREGCRTEWCPLLDLTDDGK